MALAGLSGCSALTFERGRQLGHRRNGIPDPDGRPPTGVAAAPRGAPDAQDTRDPGDAAATAPVPPVIHPADLVWKLGPGPAADAKVVNIFGEMDGMPRPPTTVTGDAGYQQHTFTDEGGDGDVNVDPSGRWLIFSSTRHSEHTDVYLQRVDGTAVTQLTNDAADDAYPCFSPDGKQVAFASTRSGTWQIYLMDTDGRNVVQVTNGIMQCIHPSFSPDGGRLVYSAIGSRSNQWELWVADLKTNERRMIGYGLFPVWSPDKTADRIAYQRPRQRGGRWFSLWTLDLIEGEGRRMTEVAASANAAIVSPCWSPDGKRLAFATVMVEQATPAARTSRGGKETGSAKPVRTAPRASAARPLQDIWTVNADGGNRQRLTDGNGTNLSPCWAVDNRIYFITDRGGAECVWSVRADPVREMNVAKGPQEPKGAPNGPSGANAANAAADPREER